MIDVFHHWHRRLDYFLLVTICWLIQNVKSSTVEARQIGTKSTSTIFESSLRCWGNSTESREMFDGTTTVSSSAREILEKLASTTCRVCDAFRKHRQDVSDDRLDALLIFPDTAPEFISLATGLLLTNRFRITILQIHWEPEDDVIEKHQDQTDTEPAGQIYKQIMSGIPCDHPVRFVDDICQILQVNYTIEDQKRLSFQEGKCRGPISLHPFDSCAIQAARTVALLIRNNLPTTDESSPLGHKTPDVMITDASLIGGLWMSEVWRVPTVTVGTSALIPLAVEHDAIWMNRTGSWWSRLIKLLRQRFYSLSITRAYMEMNKMRSEFALPLLRKPIDYLGPVSAILMEFAPVDSIPTVDSEKAWDIFAKVPQQWERIHVVGPLYPPCVPCEVKSKSPPISLLAPFRDKPAIVPKIPPKDPTVLVVPPVKLTPVWTRNILQALLMARNSLEHYDDCDWDSLFCQKSFAKFKIVWLVKDKLQETYFPNAIFDFIERESYVSLLDSVANHPTTMLVLMPCDKDTAVFETTLDISTVCLESTDRFPLRPDQEPPSPSESSRVLAAKVLSKLRERQYKDRRPSSVSTSTKDYDNFSPGGSLTRAVSIIEHVARVHNEMQPWDDVTEMQRVTSQAVKDLTQGQWMAAHSTMVDEYDEGELDWQPPYDTFTVLVAWIILFVSAAYITLKDILSSRSFRRSHHHCNPNNTTSQLTSDGILTRPDLEAAWMTLLDWYYEQPNSLQQLYKSIMGEPTSSEHVELENADSSRHPMRSPNQGQHSRRRKKR